MLIQPTVKIKQTFNRAEHSYDRHATLQHTTAMNLIHFLKNHVVTSDTIIDLGCGTGLNTDQLAQHFAYKEFYAVDIANLFLAKAKKNLASHKINLLEIDFEKIETLKKTFDLINSNMALQWSIHFEVTLKRILSLLNHNGIFAFSLPLMGTFAEFKSYYAKNKFLTCEFILEQIPSQYYQLLVSHTETYTLPYADTAHALKSIKEIGANYVYDRSHKGLRGKSFLNKTRIEQLTYVIGYFLIKRIG